MFCDSDKQGISRRDLLTLGVAGVTVFGLGVSRQIRAAEGAPTALSPEAALAKLKAGNKRLSLIHI